MRSSFISSHSYVLWLHKGWLSSPAESIQIQKPQDILFFHHSTATPANHVQDTYSDVPEGKKQATTKVVVKASVAYRHDQKTDIERRP